MEHPQPAFEFLSSLSSNPPENNVFIGWSSHVSGEVEEKENIRDHPEIWESFELPDALAGLEEKDPVVVQMFEGSISLNALAIGLGLEEIRYEPERFPALVYKPSSSNATVLVWQSEFILSIPHDSESTSEAISGIEHLVERLRDLGLTDNMQIEDNTITRRVSSR